MRDEEKTREQLVSELADLRRQLDALRSAREDWRRAEEEMRRNTQRFEAILGSASDGTFEWDIASGRLEWSERLHAILGTSPDRFSGSVSELLDRIHPEDIAGAVAAMNAHFERRAPYSAEMRLRREDGRYIWVLSTGRATRDASGKPVRMVGSITDIDRAKRAEEALREDGERYRTLIEQLPEAIFVASPSGRFVEANPRASEVLGYPRDELLRLGVADLMPPDQLVEAIALFGRLVERGSVFGELRLLRADGAAIEVELSCARLPQGDYLGSLRDVTERRSQQEQLLQSQRIESIGRLASGIAHDLNNLLTPIMGYAQLGTRALPSESHVRNYLREIQSAAERAANLTRQLLAFSRRQIIEPKVINLNELIRAQEPMLRRIVGESVTLETRLSADLGLVNVDPGQIELALVNMATNARDAMPGGGRLAIKTANVTLDEDYARRHHDAAPGEYVMVVVSDNGIGMTEEVRSHAFDPFFTTKRMGEGSGLGLSTCYGIVAQSGGHITIESAPGQGATFRIYLPRFVGTGEETPLPEAESSAPPMPGGSETVLLTEDEDSVREVAASVLRQQGYTVFEAAGGADALRIAGERPPGQIHLLLTDVAMPAMTGPELAGHFRRLHPDAKVLFTSGYAENSVLRQGMIGTGAAFIQKPFTPEALAQKVRELLDS